MNASERSGSREVATAAVPALLILGVALALALNIDDPYGWDEGAYLASARAMTRGHPLFSSVFSSQPPIFLELLAAAFRVFGDSGATGAWMEWFFAVACLAVVGWIARQVGGTIASPIAVLAMLSKLFLGQATAIEAEIPALALALLAVAMVCVRGDQAWRVAAAGGLFALAVLCKLWVIPYGLPLVVLTVLPPQNPGDGSWRVAWPGRRAALRRLIVLTLSGALVTVLVLCRYDLHEAYDQVIVMHLEARQLNPGAWGRSGTDLLVRFARDEFGVLGLALGGAALLSRRNPAAGAWLLLWVFASAAFLVSHSPVFIRHVLLLSPPLAVLAGSAVGGLSVGSRPWAQPAAAAVAAALLLGRPTSSLSLGAPLWRNLGAVRRPDPAEAEAVRLMIQFTQPWDVVVTDDPLQAFLAGRALPPRLVDISGTRVLSGQLTTREATEASRDAKLIVFWSNNLQRLPGYRAWVQSRYRKMKKWKHPTNLREMWIQTEPP